jgi:uncharacterized membrane protein YvbJ
MTTCQACGTKNAPGTTYCTKCARKLDAETQQRVVRQRAEHTATGINWASVIISIVILIIVIAVIALFALHVI